MTVSVAMAAYNGEEYISQQIDSILDQLGKEDELIVSINPSTDRTEEIVRQYADLDKRVKFFICNASGVLKNFENAISESSKDIIMLADQDDIWAKDKLYIVKKRLEDKTISGICHGCIYIDSTGELTQQQPEKLETHKVSILEILKKNRVQGSCLAFRSDLKKWILPFPDRIPMHDSWIGLMICKHGVLLYLDEPLLLYRQHEGTVTVRKHGSVKKMIISRMELINALLHSK